MLNIRQRDLGGARQAGTATPPDGNRCCIARKEQRWKHIFFFPLLLLDPPYTALNPSWYVTPPPPNLSCRPAPQSMSVVRYGMYKGDRNRGGFFRDIPSRALFLQLTARCLGCVAGHFFALATERRPVQFSTVKTPPTSTSTTNNNNIGGASCERRRKAQGSGLRRLRLRVFGRHRRGGRRGRSGGRRATGDVCGGGECRVGTLSGGTERGCPVPYQGVLGAECQRRTGAGRRGA